MNPKQQRFFKTNDLHELFTLGSSKNDKKYGTETAVIFSATASHTTKGKQNRSKEDKQQIKFYFMRLSSINFKIFRPVDNSHVEKSLDDSLKEMSEIEERDMGGDGNELSEEAKHRLKKLAKKLAM